MIASFYASIKILIKSCTTRQASITFKELFSPYSHVTVDRKMGNKRQRDVI
jgi:hypothetical protein